MRKNVLFIVHGIGNHESGWSKGAQKILETEFSRYMAFSNKSTKLRDQLTVVEITYNDIFTSIWSRWSQLIDRIDVPSSADAVFSRLVDQLGEPAQSGSQLGNNRKIDYVGDAVLYYAIELVQRLVQLRVMSEISRHMTRHLQQDHRTEFGILAHSMGTAVVHDAVHKLGSVRWTADSWADDAEASLSGAETLLRNRSGRLSKADKNLLGNIKQRAIFPGPLAESFKFSAIIMIANTSRSLGRTVDPYQSIVRPSPDPLFSDVVGFTDYFINVSHTLDPVAQINRFDTEKINDPTGFAIDVSLSHLYEENIHALWSIILSIPAAHQRPLRYAMCQQFWQERA